MNKEMKNKSFTHNMEQNKNTNLTTHTLSNHHLKHIKNVTKCCNSNCSLNVIGKHKDI